MTSCVIFPLLSFFESFTLKLAREKTIRLFNFRMVPWTTTSSCCRTTRCPTWSAPRTSSTRQRSSLKVVDSALSASTLATLTNIFYRSYRVRAELHGRVGAHPGDRGQVAVPGVQGVPVWPRHLHWCSLCHGPGPSTCTSRHRAYWIGHEIWGNNNLHVRFGVLCSYSMNLLDIFHLSLYVFVFKITPSRSIKETAFDHHLLQKILVWSPESSVSNQTFIILSRLMLLLTFSINKSTQRYWNWNWACFMSTSCCPG